MNMLDFLSIFIWQCICAWIIWLIHTPIIKLINRTRRFKWGDAEFNFNKIADEYISSGEKIIDIEDSDKNISITNPQLAIKIAWEILEKAAQTKLEKLLKNKQYNIISYHNNTALEYLQHKGCFSDEINSLINDLRAIRNKAVNENADDISYNIAKRYVALINTIKIYVEKISNIPAARVLVLNMVISVLVHLIDTGKFNHITIDEIHKHIDNRTLIDFIASLDDRAKCIFDITFTDERKKKYFLDTIDSVVNCADYSRHYGINDMSDNTNGLLALLALTNEIIQQNYSDKPLYNDWE